MIEETNSQQVYRLAFFFMNFFPPHPDTSAMNVSLFNGTAIRNASNVSTAANATHPNSIAFSVVMVTALLRSIATALTMAGAGIVLGRKGLIPRHMSSGLAKISMYLTFPSLLFSNVLYCAQDWEPTPCPSTISNMLAGWPIIILPALYSLIGGALGYIVVKIFRPNADFKRGVVAACAFGNSTTLPVTLLQVIHEVSRRPGGPRKGTRKRVLDGRNTKLTGVCG
jgi:hypothetical protein